MAKIKHISEVMRLFDKSNVVSFSSIKRLVEKKESKEYAKQLVHYLIKKGRIKKLAKGLYTSRNDINLSIFFFKPAYFGLQDAMSFYEIWEQETIPVILTLKKVRKGMRKVLGSNVLIRSINKKYFFGFAHFQEGTIALPYSDIEKTFIDMIYFRQSLDEDALEAFREKIDKKKLGDYLKRYPLPLRKRVMKAFRTEAKS